MTWRVAAVLLGSAVALLHAPAAGAATGNVGGGALTFAGEPGEANTVSISYDAASGIYKFTDPTGTFTSGSGCGGLGHDLYCNDDNVSLIVVNLLDGNDKWLGGDSKVAPVVDGGDGNDDLEGIGLLAGGDGNDTLKSADAGTQLDGGPGDDLVVGNDADDQIDGGDGNDLLIGNDGTDSLTGGPGLDRIDATGEGVKTIDCQGRDDEIIQGSGANVRRVRCSRAPKARISVPRVSLRGLLSRGLRFSVRCDRPCAVSWVLRPDATLRSLVGGTLGGRRAPVDEDGFVSPLVGRQRFTARVAGKRARTAVGKLKSLSATLAVTVTGRDGLSSQQSNTVKIG